MAFFLLAALPICAWSFNADQDIVVHVQKDGPQISVDVDCPVDAPSSVVWEVLTDYDHMAQFVSNLEYSGVTDRKDNVLRVHQSGKATRGPLTLTFDNIREVELLPYHEIRSRLISGDLKSSDFITRIVEVSERCGIPTVDPVTGCDGRITWRRRSHRPCGRRQVRQAHRVHVGRPDQATTVRTLNDHSAITLRTAWGTSVVRQP